MNEKYVTNLEISQGLCELGVPQESEFYWVNGDYMQEGFQLYGKDEPIPILEGDSDYGAKMYSVSDVAKKYKQGKIEDVEIYSAFTVGELGEKLPKNVGFIIEIISTAKPIYEIFNRKEKKKSEAYTEANARGLMLIYLLEQKLIKVEDL